MNQESIAAQFQKSADNAAPIGGVIKFKLDEHTVIIDGSGDKNEISMTDDREANTTITTSVEVMEKLRTGQLNPMMAVMSGKIKISGDMGLAMKLQSLLK